MSGKFHPRFYTIQIACHEITLWATSDSHVDRVTRRWIRMFWDKYLATLPQGSIAWQDATDDPMVVIYRHPWHPTPGVIGPGAPARLYSYAVASVLT